MEQQLASEQQRLREEKNLEIQFEPSVAGLIAARCAERSTEGARVCGRMISELVITPLIDFFLRPENQNASGARVGIDGSGDLTVRRQEASS